MGYYANGGGQVMLRKDELGTPVKLPDDLLKMLGEDFSEVADSPDGGLWLTHEYNKYHSDDVEQSMEALASYVTSGDVEFAGEDDCHWRFHFENGEVEEQSGEITYKSNKQKMRTFNVVYDHSMGENETQVDIKDGSFANMVNEMLRLVYQITDESDEHCVQIAWISEFPYDGEEE